jgi:hypothetical protein
MKCTHAITQDLLPILSGQIETFGNALAPISAGFFVQVAAWP